MVTNTIRNALETMYIGRMSIMESIGLLNEDTKVTDTEYKTVIEDIPCRISFKTISTVLEQDESFKAMQEIKLFCAPEIKIAEGSILVITQNGKTNAYERSGTPAIYNSHQEVILSLMEAWV